MAKPLLVHPRHERATVLKLMREENCHSQARRRKYRSYNGETGTLPRMLEPVTSADAPKTYWATDVTEFRVCDTRLAHLSLVVDCSTTGSLITPSDPAGPAADDGHAQFGLPLLDPAEHPILHSDKAGNTSTAPTWWH